MRFSRIYTLAGALALAGASTLAAAQTQYRILVGYPPGGVQNLQARIFADKPSEATGHTFVVENRSGAAGQIAAKALKATAPDGATLLMTADSNISVYPHTVKKPANVPLTAFVPIARMGAAASAHSASITLITFKGMREREPNRRPASCGRALPLARMADRPA